METYFDLAGDVRIWQGRIAGGSASAGAGVPVAGLRRACSGSMTLERWHMEGCAVLPVGERRSLPTISNAGFAWS